MFFFQRASDVAEISVFIANNHTNNLTVNETDPVTLKCTAVGRPTPAMRIVKNGQRVAHRPRGQVSPEDTATLVHRVSRAECSEAGRYGCQRVRTKDQGAKMPQKGRNDLSFVECVWQPVPDNGHDTAERPVAPYTSACCLCSHRIQRCFVCKEERRGNEVGCIRVERVCIRGERNGFVLILYPWGNEFLLILYLWGTGFCWYCICGERVSVGIVSTGLSCFCVQFSSLTVLGTGRSIYYRCDP